MKIKTKVCFVISAIFLILFVSNLFLPVVGYYLFYYLFSGIINLWSGFSPCQGEGCFGVALFFILIVPIAGLFFGTIISFSLTIFLRKRELARQQMSEYDEHKENKLENIVLLIVFISIYFLIYLTKAFISNNWWGIFLLNDFSILGIFYLLWKTHKLLAGEKLARWGALFLSLLLMSALFIPFFSLFETCKHKSDCAAEKALKTGDYSLCEKIKNAMESQINACYLIISKKLDDVSFCEKVSYDYRCVRNIAINKKERDLCRLADGGNSFFTDMCYSDYDEAVSP